MTIGSFSAVGWTPSLEYTTLSAGAVLNATTIILTDDLGLQQGDQIIIGSGNTFGVNWSETTGMVYTVSSYNATTKTITLSSGLQTARLKGDYVSIASRPILINQLGASPGYYPLIKSVMNNVNLTGVAIVPELTFNAGYASSSGWTLNHCSFLGGIDVGDAVENLILSTFNYCMFQSIPAGISSLLTFNNCSFFCSDITYPSQYGGTMVNSTFNNCIGENLNDLATIYNVGGLTNTFNNCTFKALASITWGGGNFHNCQLSGEDSMGNPTVLYGNGMYEFKMVNTVLNVTGSNPFFEAAYGKLYNCLFNLSSGSVALSSAIIDRPNWAVVESFDHQQLTGNYAAWMTGGMITTQLNGSTPQINKLVFNPTSTTAPVFGDFKFTVPANKLIKPFNVPVTLSALGMTMQLQIIDPANDPLIDSSATPLVTVNAANVTTAQNLSINYKSTVAKELILRVLCQAASGTVNVDVTQIMQSMAKPPMIVKR
jgi:hypothetical protein